MSRGSAPPEASEGWGPCGPTGPTKVPGEGIRDRAAGWGLPAQAPEGSYRPARVEQYEDPPPLHAAPARAAPATPAPVPASRRVPGWAAGSHGLRPGPARGGGMRRGRARSGGPGAGPPGEGGLTPARSHRDEGERPQGGVWGTGLRPPAGDWRRVQVPGLAGSSAPNAPGPGRLRLRDRQSRVTPQRSRQPHARAPTDWIV